MINWKFFLASRPLLILALCLLTIFSKNIYSQDLEPTLMLPIGHTSWVSSAQFSPDGKHIVTVAEDNTAKVWNAISGELLQILEEHSSGVNSAQFSPDGKRIVTVSGIRSSRFRLSPWFSGRLSSAMGIGGDNTAKVWDAISGQLLQRLEGHTSVVSSAQFSPDGSRIVTASWDNTAKVWDTVSGQLLQNLEGDTSGVSSAQFSPDGKRIVTTSRNNTIKVWDAESGQLLQNLRGHTDMVSSAQFSPDGNRILTASWDNTAKVWDAVSGQLLQNLKGHTDVVYSAQFSPDGKRIVTTSRDNTAKVWDAVSGQLLQNLEGDKSKVSSAQFSPDGSRIVTASWDNTTKIWDTVSGQLLQNLEGDTSGVFFAQFSPDGNRIVTASWDNTAKVWDAESGQLLQNLKGHTSLVYSAQFSPDGKHIITASWDNTAKVWDAVSSQLLQNLRGHTDMVYSAQFSPDGNRIVTASWDNTAKVWDAESGQLLQNLKGHTDVVYSAQFSPDGKLILTASVDTNAKVWDAVTGQVLQNLEGHTDMVLFAQFSPDGKRILTASGDNTAKVWDAVSGQLIQNLKGHTGIVFSAQFSPDGKRILTASWDNTAKVWDAVSGQLMQSLEGHTSVVNSAQFSRDGKRILTASWDNTANVWDAVSGQLMQSLEGHTDMVYSAQFSSNGKTIITTGNDHRTILWDAKTGKILYTRLQLNNGDWLVYDELYRYDGTQGVRDRLYFVCGLEVIKLNQLRDALYVPGLATKILNGEDINFPKLEELEICGVFPDIQLKKETEDYFKYLIKPGKKEVETLEIWLNNRLFRSLPFSSAVKTDDVYVLSISRPEIEAFFVKGEDNTISVNGLIRLMDTEARSRGMAVVNREYREKQANPRLFSLMIGVNDYRDDRLNLRFPAKDAMDLGEAIELAAEKLLGEDNVFTYYVHSKVNQTGGFTTPEKEGIRRALEEIGKQSRPEDVLLIFFAGHGTVRDSDGQFVLLTADASELLPTGITTAELQEWISPDGPHQMKANKAILIFDACNSGRGAEEMIAWARSDEETRRRRQIDDLSDKAGMYILAASAASQNAYEVRHYEQGLLSYSLLHTLQNNPGILDDNSFLNVQKWFLDSESYLQNMVRELGLQQQAQPYGTANIRIGIVDDEVRSAIRLAEIRPVVYCALAVNSAMAFDDLQIKDRLNNALREISDRGSAASVIYSYQGSTQAYRINVIYELEGDKIKCRISLLRANEPVHQMEISGSVDYMEDLIEQILDGVLEVVD